MLSCTMHDARSSLRVPLLQEIMYLPYSVQVGEPTQSAQPKAVA